MGACNHIADRKDDLADKFAKIIENHKNRESPSLLFDENSPKKIKKTKKIVIAIHTNSTSSELNKTKIVN